MFTDVRGFLEELVRMESPSGDAPRVEACIRRFASALEALGARVRFVDAPGFGVHLVGDVGPAEGGTHPPVLVIGHLDTVHPVGGLESNPLREEDGRLHGPGVYDMKAGLAAFVGALHEVVHGGGLAFPVRIIVTADEEVGSGSSRALLEEEGRQGAAALVLEPPLPGGGVKSRRKGVAQYALRVMGVPAHAGIEPERGASAIHELGTLIPRVTGVANPALGTTVNIGQVRGGTGVNVVAEQAELVVDVRFFTQEEGSRVDAHLRGLAPENPRCRYSLEGGVNRWPLEATPASEQLLERVRSHARSLGRRLEAGATGGASDGNLLSAVGCPVLDGLGLDGSGAHTQEEHILLADLPFRQALYARILQDSGFLSGVPPRAQPHGHQSREP